MPQEAREKYTREIVITDSFEGFHCWPDAPNEVAFLRNFHRHIFHVKVGMGVLHADRAREFFIEKRKLRPILDKISRATASCETMAETILDRMQHASWCEVWEDNENGARITRL